MNVAKRSWDPFDGRPKTIREVAAFGYDGAPMREFLDEFYSEQDPDKAWAMLRDEPELTGDERADAWYAASATLLSYRIGRDAPAWVTGEDRYLKRAWFPLGLESMKATLIQQSPAPFRERMIFVESDPLSRPRRSVGFGSIIEDTPR